MRIIIAGAGEVGFHLAKLLASEGKDITLIDVDDQKLNSVSKSLDLVSIKGSSTSIVTLSDAEVSKADMVIAVTSSEEINITTCILAKHMGAKRTIARISNTEFLINKEKIDLKDMGIDEIISPESLAAREIKRLLREAALTDIFDFDGGLLSLIGMRIDEKSLLANKSLLETAHFNPDFNFITVAILRDNETIIPRGNTVFQKNDLAYFIAEPEGVSRVLNLARKKRVDMRNIMILGGSKVGIHTAKMLSTKYNVKLIEQDKEKCFDLANELPDTLIINGDGREIELLEQEGIRDIDIFIAVTGNSETNIISCLVAKKFDVIKTISLVENMDYIHLSQAIGVDTMINKKLIAANFIFRYIRKGEVLSLTSIHGVDAEIIEIEVKEGSKILEDELRNLGFPEGSIVGGVIRNGKGYIPMGSFEFEPRDRVVMLTKPECVRKTEAFFK